MRNGLRDRNAMRGAVRVGANRRASLPTTRASNPHLNELDMVAHDQRHGGNHIAAVIADAIREACAATGRLCELLYTLRGAMRDAEGHRFDGSSDATNSGNTRSDQQARE